MHAIYFKNKRTKNNNCFSSLGQWKHWMLKKNLYLQKNNTLVHCPASRFLCKITPVTGGTLRKKNDFNLDLLVLWDSPQWLLFYNGVNFPLHFADKSAHGYIEAHPSVSVRVTF